MYCMCQVMLVSDTDMCQHKKYLQFEVSVLHAANDCVFVIYH